MSGLKYDSRTVAAMAGGLTGSGHKSGAALKKDFAAIRAAVPTESKNKSNQELTLLLATYNDEVEQVIEALRTGDADKTTGGWETTVKKGKSGKGKKVSESDSINHPGGDAASVSSNNAKTTTTAVAPSSNHQTGKGKGASSGNEKGQSLVSQEVKNGGGGQTPSSRNGQEQHHTADAKKKLDAGHKAHDIPTIAPPKDVAIPDIHTYSESLKRLNSQLAQTNADDLLHLDQAMEKLRRTLDHRHDTLRRDLQRSNDVALETIQLRQRQLGQLSQRVAQSGAMTPQEYAGYQEDVAAFTGDYKLDVHLASTAKFLSSVDHIQKELAKFGHVAVIEPSYSYQPLSHPQGHVSQVDSYSTRGQSAPVSQSSTKTINSAAAGSSRHQQDYPQQQQQARQPVVKPALPAAPAQERVTVIPKDVIPGAAPLGSLVISGGNLTPEEMVNLTRSLENSLRYPVAPAAPPVVKPIGSALDNGDTYPAADIFRGLTEGAIWTNSNTTYQTDTWNRDDSAPTVGPIGQPTPSYTNGQGRASAFRGGNGSRRTGSARAPRRGGPSRGGRGGSGSSYHNVAGN